MSFAEEEINHALNALVEEGLVEMHGVDDQGDLTFALTQKGRDYAEQMAARANMTLEEMSEAVLGIPREETRRRIQEVKRKRKNG